MHLAMGMRNRFNWVLLTTLVITVLTWLYFKEVKADITGHPTRNTYTLGFKAIFKGVPDDFAYTRIASQICSRGYRVIDKTYKDEAIGYKGKWVISCQEDKVYND